MKNLIRWITAAALALVASPSLAQTGTSVQFPAGWAPSTSVCVKQVDGTCTPIGPAASLPISGKQEAFLLVSNNVAGSNQVTLTNPSGAFVAGATTTVTGGDYIYSQTCTAYGTDALAVLGPDGATYQTAVSKTAADTTGGTGLALAGAALVKGVPTGTAGCYATLSRVAA